jgi:hypothetical protein
MLQKLAILGALLACVCFQSMASGSPQDDGQPVKKRAGAEARGRDTNAARGERTKRNEGQAGAAGMQRGNRDPAKMASMMMQKFDTDGDEKLNAEELVALLTFMQERRGEQRGNAGNVNRPRPGTEKGSAGKDEKADEVGGVKPRRPPTE